MKQSTNANTVSRGREFIRKFFCHSNEANNLISSDTCTNREAYNKSVRKRSHQSIVLNGCVLSRLTENVCEWGLKAICILCKFKVHCNLCLWNAQQKSRKCLQATESCSFYNNSSTLVRAEALS